jgi:hypothetical protein
MPWKWLNRLKSSRPGPAGVLTVVTGQKRPVGGRLRKRTLSAAPEPRDRIPFPVNKAAIQREVNWLRTPEAQAFNSFFSSLRKPQSVCWAMSLFGFDFIKPAWCILSA